MEGLRGAFPDSFTYKLGVDVLYCPQDGHAPEDFVKQINDEYDRLNSFLL